ncbi:MAG: hypothetical protein ACREPV_12140 [Lysobacter sp.]
MSDASLPREQRVAAIRVALQDALAPQFLQVEDDSGVGSMVRASGRAD